MPNESPGWPQDLYFENQTGNDPLRAQIENNNSASDRLARLLDIADSPIRAKVGAEALNPGKILKTPPKTKAELIQSALAVDDLSTYGPCSREVLSNMSNRAAPFPQSIHNRPHPDLLLPEKTSFSRRDYTHIGNRTTKEHVEGGISIYEDAVDTHTPGE